MRKGAEAAFSKSLELAPNDERIVIEIEDARTLLQLTPSHLTLMTSMKGLIFDFADVLKKEMAGEGPTQ